MPAAGQFYMLAGEDGTGRAAVHTAAGVLGRRRARTDDGARLGFLLEAVGPGTERLAALEPGGSSPDRPARAPFSALAELAPDAAGAILVGGGIGIAPLAMLRRELSSRGVPSAPCSASATRPTRAASTSFTARRSAPPPRMGTPATRATSPICSR